MIRKNLKSLYPDFLDLFEALSPSLLADVFDRQRQSFQYPHHLLRYLHLIQDDILIDHIIQLDEKRVRHSHILILSLHVPDDLQEKFRKIMVSSSLETVEDLFSLWYVLLQYLEKFHER